MFYAFIGRIDERLFFAVLNERNWYTIWLYRFNMKKCKILFVLLVLRTYFEFLLLHSKPYKELFNLYSVKTNIVQLLLPRSGKFNTKKTNFQDDRSMSFHRISRKCDKSVRKSNLSHKSFTTWFAPWKCLGNESEVEYDTMI